VKKYLQAAQHTLLAAFCQETHMLGGEEAERFNKAKDTDVACG
jgi:hypothetical protein